MTNKDNGQRDTRAIIILSVIVTLLIGVLIASICMQGFTELDPFGLFGEKQEQPDIPGGETGGGDLPGDGGDIVIDPDDPNANMMKISVTPTAVTAADDGLTKQLTATVLPSNAEDKRVDWSISWISPLIEPVKGKVTNYVTVTPTSDGSRTATVKCLQAFSDQIIITVTSRARSDVKATCTVDFKEKVEYRLVPGNDGVGYPSFNLERVTNGKYTKKVTLKDSSIKLRFEFTDEFWRGCHAGMFMNKFGVLYENLGSQSWTITPVSATADLIQIKPNYSRIDGGSGVVGLYDVNMVEYLPRIAGSSSEGYYLLHGVKLSYGTQLKDIYFPAQSVVYPFFTAGEYGGYEFDHYMDLMLEWLKNHAFKDALSQGITIANIILEISENNNGQQYEIKFPVSDCKAHKAEIQEIVDTYVMPSSW